MSEEAKRVEEARVAEARAVLEGRFNAVVGERKFVHYCS